MTVLLATEALRPGNVPWPLVLTVATGLGFILILIRLIIGHDPRRVRVRTPTCRGASASG